MFPTLDRAQAKNQLGAFVEAHDKKEKTPDEALCVFLADWMKDHFEKRLDFEAGTSFGQGLVDAVAGFPKGSETYIKEVHDHLIGQANNLRRGLGDEVDRMWQGAMADLAVRRLTQSIGKRELGVGCGAIASQQSWDQNGIDFVWLRPLGDGNFEAVGFQIKSTNGLPECAIDITTDINGDRVLGQIMAENIVDSSDLNRDYLERMRHTTDAASHELQRSLEHTEGFESARIVGTRVMFVRTSVGETDTSVVNEMTGSCRRLPKTDRLRAQLASQLQVENVTSYQTPYEQRIAA